MHSKYRPPGTELARLPQANTDTHEIITTLNLAKLSADAHTANTIATAAEQAVLAVHQNWQETVATLPWAELMDDFANNFAPKDTEQDKPSQDTHQDSLRMRLNKIWQTDDNNLQLPSRDMIVELHSDRSVTEDETSRKERDDLLRAYTDSVYNGNTAGANALRSIYETTIAGNTASNALTLRELLLSEYRATVALGGAKVKFGSIEEVELDKRDAIKAHPALARKQSLRFFARTTLDNFFTIPDEEHATEIRPSDMLRIAALLALDEPFFKNTLQKHRSDGVRPDIIELFDQDFLALLDTWGRVVASQRPRASLSRQDGNTLDWILNKLSHLYFYLEQGIHSTHCEDILRRRSTDRLAKLALKSLRQPITTGFTD